MTSTEEDRLVAEVDVVLLDIEGTTTPISFVHDRLFPYARENVDAYLEREWTTLACVGVVEALRRQAEADRAEESGAFGTAPAVATADPASVSRNVLWNMAQDRKMTALKELQGLIWNAGYASGELKGE